MHRTPSECQHNVPLGCLQALNFFASILEKANRLGQRGGGLGETMKGCFSMSVLSITEKEKPVFINGRKAAVIRNGGALCDIRRHSTGFLYNPPQVAIAEGLLETLSDSVVLQFTNLDSGDMWSCTVRDFRHMAKPIQFGSYEPQRAVELERMNHTIQGKAGRKNELVHIEAAPLPRQTEMFQ